MSPLVGIAANALSAWWSRRQRVTEAKAQAEIDNAAAVVSAAGWKDEYIVVIWSMPAIMSFVPGLAPYAVQGFESLKQAPEWYLVGWVGISMAVFGLKPVLNKLKDWRNGR